jgi:2-polyprenyl-3-methyl-5-hydroxy-6-metoxy-1,4-benzoquinol methylase
MSQVASAGVSIDALNDTSVAAWETNAATWDNHMGDEGNEFFTVLEWPAVERLACVKEGDYVLDLATGNGLVARKFAGLGAIVTAIDASRNLIELAARRRTKEEASQITYKMLDVTKDADFQDMIEEGLKVLVHLAQFCLRPY